MELYDTHVHFQSGQPEGDIQELVKRAADAGVARIVAVGGSPSLNAGAIAAAKRYPAAMGVALGFDRDQAPECASTTEALDVAMAHLRAEIGQRQQEGLRIVAVGEMGLDYHYSAETADMQKRLFDAQLSLSRDLLLPVVVHSREAQEDTLALLRTHVAQAQHSASRIGVLHCFTGDACFAQELVAMGFYVSFSGIVTFRNADPLRAAAAVVPDDRLLIETDTPFLAPVPMRGKRNEPAFVAHVAAMLAKVRGTDVETIARLTSQNARRLFDGGAAD